MKVFISYYRKTGWFAASIFEQWLRDAGIEAIRDQRHFRPGKLPREIERHIQDADVLLVVLSHDFYRSVWTKQEITLAHQVGKDIYYVAV
ncbi:MAG: toll/interleukin-1 receptor domain-containing protein, partial [Ktedonobacteraceae bacterium]|nr:toll/interleukin-1 receptor domain-containing protein [Ktedonobacteraceae bacterium]